MKLKDKVKKWLTGHFLGVERVVCLAFILITILDLIVLVVLLGG